MARQRLGRFDHVVFLRRFGENLLAENARHSYGRHVLGFAGATDQRRLGAAVFGLAALERRVGEAVRREFPLFDLAYLLAHLAVDFLF